MQHDETVKKISYECDYCHAKKANNGLWYCFEEISEPGFRLLESKKDIRNFEMKHRTNRKNIDFCSKECAIKYTKQSIELLIEEIIPVKE